MTQRILVVDDEPHLVSSLQDVLALHGWESRAACNGREALEVMADDPCDAVLMDIRMPEVDGLTAIDGLRKVAPGTPIVLMTAFSREEIIRHGAMEGSIQLVKSRVPADVVGAAPRPDAPFVVADSERSMLDRVALILRAEDHDVRRTRSPAVAARLLDAERPTSVLLETDTPRHEGMPVSYVLDRATPTVTLFLARLAPDGEGRRAVLRGSAVRAFLSKPFHPGQLIAELREILPKGRG